MKLWNICPYVRYARIETNRFQSRMIAGVDHRLFLCESGELEIRAAGERYHLREGSLLYIRAGTPYCYRTGSTPPVLQGINFDFFRTDATVRAPLSYLPAEDFTPEQLAEPELPELPVFSAQTVYVPHAPLHTAFGEIIREYNERDLYFAERCGALLGDILIRTARLACTDAEKRPGNRTDAILACIHQHYAPPLTNTMLAKQFSYHPNYISQLIRQRTGMTLHRYLLHCRIEAAISLLQSGEYNVTEAAAAVGFQDVKHFSKCFRSITGQLPSVWLPR